ncbi:MAG: hypothetical protein OXC48_10485, partial [Endozoicomonadaceae bacterium]|nr:hypothetical protein [Endozoicomonadaceae bacterium]
QEVIDSIDSAITTIKRYKPWKKLELIGYSGGATIALLIAAKRSDIISVRTIAGNLSPDLAFHLHKLSLPASTLLPSNYLSKLELLPQIHYIGRHDAVVPQAIAQYYVEQFENKKCIRYAVIPDTTHTKGWDNVWLSLLAQQPQCS